jgi:quercetin dioxygenase-like cupin family protein
MRDKVQALQAHMEALPEEVKKELPLKHHIANGIYARELFIPAGTALVGKIHRTEHLSFVMKGAILVTTDDGVRLVRAPEIIHSQPGAKRAGYTLEDTIWVCVHRTDETDVEKLEAELIAPSFEALDEAPKLEGAL